MRMHPVYFQPPASFIPPPRERPAPRRRVEHVQAGVLLIGTPETVAQMEAQLAALAAPPTVVGFLTPAGLPARAGALRSPRLGTIDDLPAIASRFRPRLALVSFPTTMRAATVRTTELLRLAGITERAVTPIGDLLAPTGINSILAARVDEPAPRAGGSAMLATPPAIDLAKLIGREPYSIDRDAVGGVLAGKRILITGAGGSIGSELARLCAGGAGFAPAQIILMERGENALFEIDRQIARRFPSVPRRAVLHDVADAAGTRRIVGELRPHAIFHAAAHKHVPLMEDHPAHALTNNLFGTKAIADAAAEFEAERFVLISTDKAVNPTSVMGATKRLAEMYISWLAARPDSRTQMSMVRFGNVLGSACSVLTIWSSQLAEGGPLTVTDPRMTRYFMTIHEAAMLVLQSAALPGEAAPGARRAGVYVLDMGDPVLILDLARRFAAAHGLVARAPGDAPAGVVGGGGAAIEIAFSGARPGEKIHEELAYAEELLRPTSHPGVRAWTGLGVDPLSDDRAAAMIAELDDLRHSTDHDAVVSAIRRYVPEMRPAPAVETCRPARSVVR
ncbi:MAG: polysaccharide biosynthesis protein [Phycisphaeraceae bacterium]|nr:polysaccharide biosynthesis protein [Phycisphaeraceae bacterium]